MKKILLFCTYFMLCIGSVFAAVRDGNTISRSANQQRVSTTVSERKASTTRIPSNTVSARSATQNTKSVSARSATTPPRATSARSAKPATSSRTTSARSAAPILKSRAAIDTTAESVVSTRTGAEYEQCKSAFFTCMDQFCQLKNDDYRRCSCSNRVYDLSDKRKSLQDASDQLTTFTENLDVVGMTAEQVTAMRTASEGENALTSDKSASKALLQAIMNSIRGTDTNVGGKYSDLNSINLSFDTTNAFGIADAGAAVAAYNGQTLYTAVYPQCRQAVAADCNDASLQRAVTAYLMAIEQDCNTVQTAIESKQKQMKSAIREGSAMLDLARVENRKNHNSDNFAACINNIENAILSEEVCGAGYHKCLDNGEFIDITTGKPIAGVENFYKLEQMLIFASGVDAANQKLSKVTANRTFVQNFENRVKKFAKPAMDKCVEQADDAWAEYLDRALLTIYYSQKAKVDEIKQGCFDFVSACYMNGDQTLTAAMSSLTDNASLILQPDKITLSANMCSDYIASCNNMFDGNIIADYINTRQTTDTLAACRAIVKQCFDGFGGVSYNNFYYPSSGLFTRGNALDWFTLYEYKYDGTDNPEKQLLSPCAKQLNEVESCKDIIEQAFGGLDKITFYPSSDQDNNTKTNTAYTMTTDTTQEGMVKYGLASENKLNHHDIRPSGVATEIYNQILDTLSTQCRNLNGRFTEPQYIKPMMYTSADFCILNNNDEDSNFSFKQHEDKYGIKIKENMCPQYYNLSVDTQSWGACLCWENGARRSKNGTSPTCMPVLPTTSTQTTQTCQNQNDISKTGNNWCTQPISPNLHQVCPPEYSSTPKGSNITTDCCNSNTCITTIPEGY